MDTTITYLTTDLVIPRWALLSLIAATGLLAGVNVVRLTREVLVENWAALCRIGRAIRCGMHAAYGRLLDALCAPVTTDRWIVGVLLAMVFASTVIGSAGFVAAQRASAAENGGTCETVWNSDMQANLRTCVIQGRLRR